MDANVAKRLSAAGTSGGGNYFKPGFLGVLEVMEMKCKEISTKKRPSAHLVGIIEFKVVSGNGVHANGTTVSYMEEIDEGAAYPKQAAARLNTAVLAIADAPNATPAQLDAELVSALGEKNPRKGTQIQVETFAKTRTAGDPITKFIWGKVVFDPHGPTTAQAAAPAQSAAPV